MLRKYLLLGLLSITGGLVFLTTEVSADQKIENLKLAGSFLTSRIDTNGDGTASSWCMSQIKGGYQSSSMMQCVNEDVFVDYTPTCPGGLFVVDADNGTGTGTGVRTFPNAEDQIFVVLMERYLCANQFGQFTEGLDRGVIVGGAGKFEGATGTYELDYTGQILMGDPTAQPAQFFGTLIGTGTWVINTP